MFFIHQALSKQMKPRNQKTKEQKKKKKGYIALISAIVISFLLIVITVSLGFGSFFGRFDILDSESKEKSTALAEACVSQAILEASGDTFYSRLTDFTIPISGNKCKRSSEQIGNEIIIKAQAEFNKSYTNLKVIIDNSDFSVVSWKECPNFDASC
ncbi:MAG: hypothetical protein AAB340_02200 [Patescibacteria group bacterium]